MAARVDEESARRCAPPGTRRGVANAQARDVVEVSLIAVSETTDRGGSSTKATVAARPGGNGHPSVLPSSASAPRRLHSGQMQLRLRGRDVAHGVRRQGSGPRHSTGRGREPATVVGGWGTPRCVGPATGRHAGSGPVEHPAVAERRAVVRAAAGSPWPRPARAVMIVDQFEDSSAGPPVRLSRAVLRQRREHRNEHATTGTPARRCADLLEQYARATLD